MPILVNVRSALAMARVLASLSRCLIPCWNSSPGCIADVRKAFSDFRNHGGLADGAVAVVLCGKLKHFHLDLGNSFLMAKIQKAGVFDELIAFDFDHPVLIELGAGSFQEMTVFNLAGGDAVHDRQEMLALEPGFLLNVARIVPTGAAFLVIVKDHLVQDLSLGAFDIEAALIGLQERAGSLIWYFVSEFLCWSWVSPIHDFMSMD
jgi:hypothetical protein